MHCKTEVETVRVVSLWPDMTCLQYVPLAAARMAVHNLHPVDHIHLIHGMLCYCWLANIFWQHCLCSFNHWVQCPSGCPLYVHSATCATGNSVDNSVIFLGVAWSLIALRTAWVSDGAGSRHRHSGEVWIQRIDSAKWRAYGRTIVYSLGHVCKGDRAGWRRSPV